jgi:hypothetical protein
VDDHPRWNVFPVVVGANPARIYKNPWKSRKCRIAHRFPAPHLSAKHANIHQPSNVWKE